ncbi:MAG: phosphatidylglycerol lysyltransferase domain-containing protein [Muribaculaceae bacterium]|nr:phosphatidylglycerol lysyltransferase domain-containing protein [Muribaculaceae bacterium]
MESTWNFSPYNESTSGVSGDKTYINSSTLSDIAISRQFYILDAINNYVKSNRMMDEATSSLDNISDRLCFSKVANPSIPILMEYFKKHPSRSCDYSIGGILMWAEYFNYEMAIYDSTLFLKGYDPESGLFIYYAPLGELEHEIALSLIREDALGNNGESILISDRECFADESDSGSTDDTCFYDKWMEYLYDIERFLHFSGKKMEKKRNHLNFFLKHFPDSETEVISSKNTCELIDFTRNFEKTHENSPLFDYEGEQTIKVLENYGRYPFDGLLLRVDGKIIAYSFGEKIGDTFFVHVEKADTDYPGAYQAIASEMAKHVKQMYPDVCFLNREEDMGYETLRKSKESYHPFLLLKKTLSGL